LWSDHFIHGCSELATHISLLFSAMLIYAVAPDDMCFSTVIRIPKRKHANVTYSSNYRGIALSSIFGRVFGLIFLDKYSDCLCTCKLQFVVKAGHFTYYGTKRNPGSQCGRRRLRVLYVLRRH